MLSKQEAYFFLTDVLHLKDIDNLIESADRRRTINTILKAYIEKQPFQNIMLMAKEPENRHRPTWEEIKQGIFRRQGGLCYSQHVFLFTLFKTLGFDSGLAHGGVSAPNNHIVVLLKNVEKPGDLFLMEAACGYPTFEIIPLDFEEESPVYKESFLEYKFRKIDGRVFRLHRKGDIRPPNDNGMYFGEWRRFYDFELRATEALDEFDKEFEHVYTDPDETPFHRSLRFISFNGQKAKIIVNNKTLVENEQWELEPADLKSDEEIPEKLNSFTDAFDEPVVLKAIGNWRNISNVNIQ